jgi:hypothetical protein
MKKVMMRWWWWWPKESEFDDLVIDGRSVLSLSLDLSLRWPPWPVHDCIHHHATSSSGHRISYKVRPSTDTRLHSLIEAINISIEIEDDIVLPCCNLMECGG